MYSDYVLPAAHHYEIQDMTMEGRTPYVSVLDAAVEPLGDSKPDWIIMKELLEKISELAVERGIEPIQDSCLAGLSSAITRRRASCLR